ncbi:UNVERIFIED_CONTAM: hypothetical protein GTU68_020498 [Idotea baltica]|nr:hypothetical protein [Idotea baltica]
MMVEMDSMPLMKILSHTTNIIAEGEVLQLLNCHDPDTTEAAYLEVIHHKTAKLFEAAGQLGAVISDADATTEKAMALYAMHLGSAFQLVDDLLDYSESSEAIGKNIGDDLAEGKPTLPLIFAMQHGNEAQKQVICHAIEHGERDRINDIITIINDTGAIKYTSEVALKEAEQAKSALVVLPESVYKDALLALADFSVERRY